MSLLQQRRPTALFTVSELHELVFAGRASVSDPPRGVPSEEASVSLADRAALCQALSEGWVGPVNQLSVIFNGQQYLPPLHSRK